MSESSLESVAEEVKTNSENPDPTVKKKRGRPPGSKNKPKVASAESGTERAPYVKTAEGVLMSTLLANTLWNVSRIFTKRRELTEPEAKQIGEALDPVLHKYLPMASDYSIEIAFVVTVYMVWNATTPTEVQFETPDLKSSAEIIES